MSMNSAFTSEDLLHNFAASVNDAQNEKNAGKPPSPQHILSALDYLDALLRENNAMFKQARLLKPFVQLLSICVGMHRVEETLCTLITDLASHNERTLQEIGRQGAVEVIVNILHGSTDHVTVQRAVIYVAAELARVEDNRRVLIEKNVPKHLLGALKLHMNDALLVENTASAIATTVFGHFDVRVQIGEQDGIEQIIQAMRTHPSVDSVQIQGALALRNLAWQCEDNCDLLDELSTIEMFFQILCDYGHLPAVIDQIFGVLENMAVYTESVRRDIIHGKHRLGTVLKLLCDYAEDAECCEKICSLLVHICEANEFALSPIDLLDNGNFLAEGPLAVVRAMERNASPHNGTLLSKLSSFLRVCNSATFRSEFGVANGVETMLHILKSYMHDKDVTYSMLDGILCVICGDDENKRRLHDLDGVKCIVDVMRYSPPDAEIHEYCCRVLDSAADGQEFRASEMLTRKDLAVEAAKASMADYPRCAGVQESACSLFIKVASMGRHEAALLVRGGVRNSVEMARCTHRGNAAISAVTGHLLSLLSNITSVHSHRGHVAPPSMAHARLRSRSRTVVQSSRSRSRMERSASPDRLLRGGRRAMLAAREKSEVIVEEEGEMRRETVFRKRASKSFGLQPVEE